MNIAETHATTDATAFRDSRIDQLEQALAMTDIDAPAFGDRVRAACETAGFVFLFDLPTIGDDDIERIAAAADPDGSAEPLFAFIRLHTGEATLSIDTHCTALNHGEAVASAYLDLLSH